jgi:hypothetical protein
VKNTKCIQRGDGTWEQRFELQPGEVRAINNGAPILLAVSYRDECAELEIGEPSDDRDLVAQYSHGTVMHAFSIFMNRLSAAIRATARIPSDPRVIELWAEESIKQAQSAGRRS